MDYMTFGLMKIAEDFNMKKILIPAGIAAGVLGGALLTKRIMRPKWNPGQREAAVSKIEDMIHNNLIGKKRQ